VIRACSSERGIALLMVLLVVAFLSVVFSAFAFSMRTELEAARLFKEEAEAYFLAQAGIARGVAEVSNGDLGGRRTPLFDSGEVQMGRGAYQVVVTDEESKLPLNQVQPEVLKRLLQNTGVQDQAVQDAIVDAMLDWRDPDNLRRPSGAEDEYYRSLPRPYHAKNGNLESVEELLLVKGITPEIFHGNVTDPDRLAALREQRPHERRFGPREYLGIRQFLTVHSVGQLNIANAEPEVLWAMGLGAEEIEAIQKGTPEVVLRARRRQPLRTGVRLTSASQTFLIEAHGRLVVSPVTYRISAVVAGEGSTRGATPRVLAWNERPK
jgi:hypothetical protein